MPWDSAGMMRHNHSLSPVQALHASHIANAILKQSGNEGMALATANKLIHRDDGGMIPATPAPTPGLQPSTTTQNPLSQNMIQRFATMSPEQLRELAPRLTGQMQQLAQRVLQQKQMTPQNNQQQTQPQQAIPQLGVAATPQPVGQTMQAAGGPVLGYAKGGAPKVEHPGADRDDCVPILAAGGEFVISPHHVARIGEGDVSEGHRRLDAWVVNARKQIVEKMAKLRPPVKS